MAKLRTLLTSAVLALGLAAGSAMAENITVVNGTGFTIQALGLADANSPDDADDLLGDEVLNANESVVINISGGTKGWELIAQDEEGGQVNWTNLNLTGVSKITLKADGTAIME